MASAVTSKSGWRRWWGAALALALLLIAGNWRVLAGLAVPQWDALDHASPLQMLIGDCAREGSLLLWNPWTNAGSPDFIEPQTAALSPVSVGLGLLIGPHFMAYNIYWLLWWFVGPIGILMLGRRIGAPVWMCLVIAIGYLFNCAYMGNAQHCGNLVAFSAIPLMLWRLDAAMMERRIWPAVESGAIWGLAALAGYPGVIIPGCGFIALWVLGRCLTGIPASDDAPANSGTKKNRWLTAGISLAIVGAISGVVLSPTYVSFVYEGRGYTDRAGALPYDVAVNANALPPSAVANFASPYTPQLWFVNPGEIWANTDFASCPMYMGVFILPLAIFALVAAPRDRWRWWLLLLALLALGAAMGDALPIRGWLYDLFYPARVFRQTTNFRYHTLVAVTVLALMGARDLASDPRKHARSFAVITAAVALAAIASFAWIMFSVKNRGPGVPLAVAQLIIGWGAACGLAFCVGALEQKRRLVFIAVAVFVAALDGVVTREVSTRTIETSTSSQAFQAIEKLQTSSLDLTGTNLGRLSHCPLAPPPNNFHLPIRLPVLTGYSPMANSFAYWMATDSAYYSLICSTNESRIWFSAEAVEVARTDAEFRAFNDRVHAAGALPAVIHSRETMLNRAAQVSATQPASVGAPIASRIIVKLVRYFPNELQFSVDCPSDGWLFVTDRWSRSWRATVDGVETPVLGGAFIFRAVRVHRGANLVQFDFKPMGMPLMLIVSWSTLAAVALGSIFLAWKQARVVSE